MEGLRLPPEDKDARSESTDCFEGPAMRARTLAALALPGVRVGTRGVSSTSDGRRGHRATAGGRRQVGTPPLRRQGRGACGSTSVACSWEGCFRCVPVKVLQQKYAILMLKHATSGIPTDSCVCKCMGPQRLVGWIPVDATSRCTHDAHAWPYT